MRHFLTWPVLIRFGLGCAFLSQSLTAFLTPAEFQDLLSSSVVAGLLPVSVASFVTFIGYNDLIVALLLFSGWRTRYVAMYATAWLVGVVSVIGVTSLDALEHVAFFSMSIALALRKE